MVWPTLGLRTAEEQSKTVTKLERTSLCSATYVADNVALPAFAAARPPCCQAAAGERRAAIDRYLLLAVPTAGNQQQRSASGTDDRRTPYRYIDPAPHTMQAVPCSGLVDFVVKSGSGYRPKMQPVV